MVRGYTANFAVDTFLNALGRLLVFPLGFVIHKYLKLLLALLDHDDERLKLLAWLIRCAGLKYVQFSVNNDSGRESIHHVHLEELDLIA